MEMSEMELLIDLVKRSSVRELTLRNGDSRVTLKKTSVGAQVEVGGDLVPYQAESEQVHVSTIDSVYALESGIGIAEMQEAIEPVTAPLVGVFHHIKPLVGPGAQVTAGEVVAVIEAMNLITEVTSPVNGTVVETVIKDGMPAEYGQTLFLVKAER